MEQIAWVGSDVAHHDAFSGGGHPATQPLLADLQTQLADDQLPTGRATATARNEILPRFVHQEDVDMVIAEALGEHIGHLDQQRLRVQDRADAAGHLLDGLQLRGAALDVGVELGVRDRAGSLIGDGLRQGDVRGAEVAHRFQLIQADGTDDLAAHDQRQQ